MREWTEWHDLHSDKIEIIAGIDCWIWKAGRTAGKKHGRVRFTRKNGDRYSEYAHRAAFISAHGGVNKGKMICHKCGVGLCVRPGHLYEGTAADNGKDMADMKTGLAMLSYDQAYEVRKMYMDGVSLSEISKKFGIAYGSVYPIVIGKSYKHANFPDGMTYGNRIRNPLSEEEIVDIRKMLACGFTQSSIARKHSIPQSIISRIKTGKRHKVK